MIEIEKGLLRFAAGGGTIAGAGESIADYQLPEKGFLNSLPVCPVEIVREPAPLPYTVGRTASGDVVIRCLVHGSRERMLVTPTDPAHFELVDKAKQHRSERNRLGALLLVVLIWGSPVFLFLAGAAFFGKARMARAFPFLRRMYLLPNFVILIGWLPGWFLAPIPPAQDLLNAMALIALTTVFLVHVASPIVADWKTDTPQE